MSANVIVIVRTENGPLGRWIGYVGTADDIQTSDSDLRNLVKTLAQRSAVRDEETEAVVSDIRTGVERLRDFAAGIGDRTVQRADKMDEFETALKRAHSMLTSNGVENVMYVPEGTPAGTTLIEYRISLLLKKLANVTASWAQQTQRANDLMNHRGSLPRVTAAFRKKMLGDIKRAVVAELPEDEHDDVRPWVYQKALDSVIKNLAWYWNRK